MLSIILFLLQINASKNQSKSLKLKLLEMGLIKVDQEGFPSVLNPIPEESLPSVCVTPAEFSGLTFEQQKELLLIQLEFGKNKHK